TPTAPTSATHSLSLHVALPICRARRPSLAGRRPLRLAVPVPPAASRRPLRHPLRVVGDVRGESPGGVRSDVAHRATAPRGAPDRSEEHTSELQSRFDLVCRLLL